MSVLNKVSGSVGDLKNKIANPFSTDVENPYSGPDFPDGFIIEELEGPKKTVALVGNQMPLQPFKFGGTQRVKKDYYPGNSEPSTQILGPQESDQTIRGQLKDIRLPKPPDPIDALLGLNSAPDLTGASLELQELIDSIRIRGNLCRFRLGEWQRYGFIEETEFDLKVISRINYEIKLSIVGFNAPTNAKFLEKSREVPFGINEELIEEANTFAASATVFPDSVPRSIADKLNELIGEVANAAFIATSFVDTVFSTVKDVQKSVERAKGLIKHLLNKLREYKRTLNALLSDPLNTSPSFTGIYANAKFFSANTAAAVSLTALAISFRDQFSSIIPSLPLARHLVISGDTLQKIAVKFYDSADDWKRIYDYNNLTSTVLSEGSVLEIPRQ